MRGGIHNIGKGIWSVYKHTSPSGKLYIGITSKEPKKRWGKNGIHYKGQAFYNAIVKYGWDNIEHEVICNNITEFEAKEMEKELIKKFNSMDWRYGYNCTRGGRWNALSWTPYKRIDICGECAERLLGLPFRDSDGGDGGRTMSKIVEDVQKQKFEYSTRKGDKSD